MNRCPRCGRSLVSSMYWSCGRVYVEWYCLRCGRANGIRTTYSTSNTELSKEERSDISGSNQIFRNNQKMYQ